MKNKLSIRQNEGKFKQFITQLSIIEKISLVIVFLFLFLMMFGPNIAPFDPEKPNTEISLQAPDRIHWLGTDENGMDIFSRVIAAPRVDIFVGLVSALLSVAVGIPLGINASIVYIPVMKVGGDDIIDKRPTGPGAIASLVKRIYIKISASQKSGSAPAMAE